MKKLLFLCGFLLSFNTFGQMLDNEDFADEAMRQRAIALAKTIRCPQCQNQNLVESTSPVAYDLRLKVYDLVKQGKTDQAILQQMTEKYGDFIRYDPPKNAKTALLWLLPLGIFLILFIFSHQNNQIHQNARTKNNKILPISVAEDFSLMTMGSTLIVILMISLSFYAITPRWKSFQQAEEEKILRSLKPQNKTYLEILQNDLRQSPKNIELWLNLANYHLQNNEIDLALGIYQYLETLYGKQDYLFGLQAQAIYQQYGFTHEVKTYIQYALNLNPEERHSLMLLASYAFQQKDFAKAIELYQQLLASDNPKLNRRIVIQALNTAKFLNSSLSK